MIETPQYAPIGMQVLQILAPNLKDLTDEGVSFAHPPIFFANWIQVGLTVERIIKG